MSSVGVTESQRGIHVGSDAGPCGRSQWPGRAADYAVSLAEQILACEQDDMPNFAGWSRSKLHELYKEYGVPEPKKTRIIHTLVELVRRGKKKNALLLVLLTLPAEPLL